MMNPVSDPVDDLLVMHAQDGDRHSMEELVRRWQRRLWTHAYRLTASSDVAWDITQQAWIAIIKGLDRLHDPASFRAWAYRIVANKAIDHVKVQQRSEPASDPAADRRPPRQERRAILDDLLHALDPDKRAILVLYYVEGLTVPEIAFVLGIPQGTVKSRLHASRAELKRLWELDAKETGHERRRHQENR